MNLSTIKDVLEEKTTVSVQGDPNMSQSKEL
jgi:hypothetical protein